MDSEANFKQQKTRSSDTVLGNLVGDHGNYLTTGHWHSQCGNFYEQNQVNMNKYYIENLIKGNHLYFYTIMDNNL